jgi:hypothetical protein
MRLDEPGELFILHAAPPLATFPRRTTPAFLPFPAAFPHDTLSRMPAYCTTGMLSG